MVEAPTHLPLTGLGAPRPLLPSRHTRRRHRVPLGRSLSRARRRPGDAGTPRVAATIRYRSQPVPLAEVSAKIEEILSQQILDSLLADLLRDLRQQGEIHIDSSALPPAANATGQPPQQTQPRLPGTPEGAR